MPKPQIHSLLLILREACEKYGYSFEILDDHSNNLVEVSNGKKVFFAGNSKIGLYPLNPKFSGNLLRDKSRTYKLLEKKGYKIPRGQSFFLKSEMRELRGDGREIEDAYKFAREIGYPVFVKPNGLSLGLLAEKIHNEEELKDLIEKISINSYMVIIQEFIELSEYRIFAIDGEVEFVYKRNTPKIIGDGEKNIFELIERFNNKIKREENKVVYNSYFFKKQLEKLNLTIDSILEKGAMIQVFSKTNISSGGDISNYKEEVSSETKYWVKKIMRDLNIRIVGIDIFVEKTIDDPEYFTVIELNGTPSLTGIYNLGKKDKVMSIRRKIFKKYFN